MASWHGLTEAETGRWAAHFGVGDDQIRHDFAISRVLEELSVHAELFVFYGGTALSRTILDGLRLSEDIDLLTVGPRRPAAAVLDEAIRSGLERQFGLIEAHPRLPDARTDTQACLYNIADVTVQIQLIAGENYTPWSRQDNQISLRYGELGTVAMTTYTPAGFVGAKTVAWCDTTRDAPKPDGQLSDHRGDVGYVGPDRGDVGVAASGCGCDQLASDGRDPGHDRDLARC